MAQPELRFPEFTDEWKKVKLEKIVKRVTRKNKDLQTELPLTMSSLDGLVDQVSYFNKVVAGKDMSGYFLLKNGEFAYNKSYSVGFDYGSIKRLDRYEMGALSTLYICFSLNKGINSDFATKYFDSHKWYKEIYMISAVGARNHGLLNVPTEDFFKIKVALPSSIEEQNKIANFLKTIDAKIEHQESVVSGYEDFRKGMMQKIFNQEIRFKDENGKEFPKWEEKYLREILTERETKQCIAEDAPLLSFTIEQGVIDPSDKKTNKRDFLTKDMEHKKYALIEYNDIIYNPSNIIYGAIGRNKLRRGVVSPIYAIFQSSELPEFMDLLLSNKNFINGLLKYLEGTVIKLRTLKPRDFLSVKVNIPCSDEQRKIADFFEVLDKKIIAEKAILDDWKQLRKALLQQMFV